MLQIDYSLDKLEDYKEDWDEASHQSKIPIQTFNWFRCCEKAFLDKSILVISVHESPNKNRLIASIPLSIYRKVLGYPSYTILGGTILHEPSDFIYQDNNALEKLIKGMTSLKCPLILQRIPYDFNLSFFIKKSSRYKYFYSERETTSSQYINLTDNIEEFETKLSSKRKYDIKRARNKAEACGILKTEFIKPNNNNINEILDLAFDIEHNSWKGDNSSSILSRPALNKFFRCYLKNACYKEKLLVAFLKIDEIAVAMQIAIIENNSLWLLKIGHRNSFQHISPGILLTHELIKHAIKKRLDKFEFLGSTESWIRLWGPNEHRYKLCIYYPLNLSGITHLLADQIARLIRKLKKLASDFYHV